MVTLREVQKSFPLKKKFGDEIFSLGDVVKGKRKADADAAWHRRSGWFARVVPSKKYRGWYAVYLLGGRPSGRL